jgi:peptidoglycan/LPS O-acetylase OafA/YrhL
MDTPSNQAARAAKTGYLPSLDGWRALAVLGVLMTHDLPWVLFGHSDAAWKGYGGHGVELFFAISGFLITTRILEEERIVGHFDIRRFYIRRVFRIQPAAWVYLLAIALLMMTGMVRADWTYWFGGLLLYQNYLFPWTNGSALLGHFWSLAVEEHFYILLSLTLLWVKRRRLLALGLMFAVSMIPLTFSVFSRHGWIHVDATPRATQWQVHYLLWAAFLELCCYSDPVCAVWSRGGSFRGSLSPSLRS